MFGFNPKLWLKCLIGKVNKVRGVFYCSLSITLVMLLHFYPPHGSVFLITCVLLTAVDVKLDPATAHQSLEISDNGKKVRDSGKMSKDPDSPQRFNMFGSILGLNRLSSGRAYWEVEVSKKTGWDLGVARRDANRKGKLSISPDNGYWATVHYEDQKYSALTTPPVSLSPKRKPQKVGVFVDYEEGLVSFYDVTSQSHIYSFTECLFGGEILPYFSPHLKQNEKNSNPLIITAVASGIVHDVLWIKM
uniref:B30.2/SPRY domain-containing protein n=1 Tax=Neolamprologus brichardi TaxID=32507 RepID=A0A3Q4MIP3_NEOBR